MAAEAEVDLEGSNQYPAHYKVMMDKLNEQRQLDQFTDITLIVDGKLGLHDMSFSVSVKFVSSAFHFLIFCPQDTSSEPIKQYWLHAVSFSISSSRILPRSHWWR